MPGMQYEDKETSLLPGESVLLYSDGLVEAHNTERDMFSFPRLIALLGAYNTEETAIEYLRAELAAFTGEDWEQEDDITLVTLQRAPGPNISATLIGNAQEVIDHDSGDDSRENSIGDDAEHWRLLEEWSVPSEMGNERLAMSYIKDRVDAFHLPKKRMEQLQTAVAEATMNAMEHGNHYDPDVPVKLQLLSAEDALAVRIIDKGGNQVPQDTVLPDIEAKLAELQSPRGWGLFLIQNMVDEMRIFNDEHAHTIELILHLEGGNHASKNA